MQTCTRSAITDDLVATCSTQMRAAYASILREHEVDDLQWTHATLPQRKGGYGLRDPWSVVDTARLASLVKVSERAETFGASSSYIRQETDKATTNYLRALKVDFIADLVPSRELQKMLTDPLHSAAVDWIVRSADEPTRQRMNSLTTPHATAWLTSTSLMRIMTQGEFVSGLKWGGGMKFRHNAYRCPNCGSEANAYGVHAVTCQRSGAISRGHTMLRDTVAELFTLAWLPVTKEQHLPQSLDRPADLLLSS